MKCKVHDCEMEWVENGAHPEGGFWYCDECRIEEENELQNDQPACGYCGAITEGGYCYLSPDGNHHF